MNFPYTHQQPRELSDTVANAFVAFAIGDTLGSQYEFIKEGPAAIKRDFVFEYREHPDNGTTEIKGEVFQTTPAGVYTDDTQMTLANMKTLMQLVKNGQPQITKGQITEQLTKEQFVNGWLDEFKQNPIRGYAGGFQKFIESTLTTSNPAQTFLQQIQPIKQTNGGAMRAMPFGLLPNIHDVLYYSQLQAETTHTKGGVDAAVGVAYAAHLAAYTNVSFKVIAAKVAAYYDTEERLDLMFSAYHEQSPNAFLSTFKKEEEKKEEKEDEKKISMETPIIGVPCHGMKTLGAVLWVLKQYQNPLDILRESILLGGDTDSVAALALGIYTLRNPSALDTIKEQTPLFETLNNGPYGRDYIIQTGNTFVQAIKSQKE